MDYHFIKFLHRAFFVVLFAVSIAVLNVRGQPQQIHVESCCTSMHSTVNCEGCNLKELPLEMMTNTTKRLLLANNMITDLPKNSFIHMGSLQTLTISDNPLKVFRSGVFTGRYLKFKLSGTVA